MKLLTLNSQVVPKARPRVHNGIATTAPKYRAWKESAIHELRLQCKELIDCSCVDIILMGRHHRKSDADNIAGSCLDALVQANIIRDDSLMYIKRLSLELKHSNDSPYVLIQLS